MSNAEAIPWLVKLGFTSYQSKIYASLVSLGVGSVSEIYRSSRVPRTKVYEALEDLLRQGAVELQPGRPTLYRAVHPKVLVARLLEDYRESADQATRVLEKEYQEGRSAEQDVAWTVKGDRAIRRKLAELITSAKEEVLMFETYPPLFTVSVAKLLKAVAQRGVKIRPVALLSKGQAGEFPENDLIEYRSFPAERPRGGDEDRLGQDFLGPLSVTLASPYGLAVIDNKEAFVIIPRPDDESASVGLSARIPGVPLLLSVMFQQFLMARTRKSRG
ncbi:MAG: hypothetical protein OK449_10055 [Thaumarchaeota archaeon]|nr:hypothetical protein [Nitrososphaerota archaeon]